MKLSRRGLFPLSAAGIVGAASQVKATEIDENGAISMKLVYDGGWQVLVLDMWPDWRPGYKIAYRKMPVEEFLDRLDKSWQGEV